MIGWLAMTTLSVRPRDEARTDPDVLESGVRMRSSFTGAPASHNAGWVVCPWLICPGPVQRWSVVLDTDVPPKFWSAALHGTCGECMRR